MGKSELDCPSSSKLGDCSVKHLGLGPFLLYPVEHNRYSFRACSTTRRKQVMSRVGETEMSDSLRVGLPTNLGQIARSL